MENHTSIDGSERAITPEFIFTILAFGDAYRGATEDVLMSKASFISKLINQRLGQAVDWTGPDDSVGKAAWSRVESEHN